MPSVTPSRTESRGLSEVTATAIQLLVDQGFDSTTVDELADAAKISRSTFFRRFGSKEDIVFADHDYLIERLGWQLENANGDPLQAVVDGARLVLDYHLGRRDASLKRHELLQSHPALRDRELVASHRYERVFSGFLREKLQEPAEWAVVAFASGVVSVHNDLLRSWLRTPSLAVAELFEADLRNLATLFRPALVPGRGAGAAARVVVAVFDHGADPDDVLSQIRDSITSR